MRINRSIATVGLLATGWMAFGQVRINSRPDLNYATQNASYNDQLYAGGGTAPYTFTADPQTLPPGVNLSSSGLLSGTPTSSQQFSFNVTATDANNQAVTSKFFMNVCNAPWAITGNTTLPAGYVGQLYTPPAALFNVGPVCNVASQFLEFPFFTLVSGKMPPGLRLPYTGMPPGLYGTPTTAGTYVFTVRASEYIPNGRSATQQFTVTIHPPQQLAIKTFDLPQTPINSDFAFQLGATGGFVPYAWAVQPGSTLPPGLTLTAGGSLEGQPLQTGDYTFTLGVTDSHGTNLTYGYLLSVTNNSNGPMIVTNSLLPAGYTNVAYSKQLGLAGTGGAPAVWSIVAGALPTGVQIDANTGLLSGTVTAQAGAYNFTIQASAGELGQATQNATINVFAQPLTFGIQVNYLPGVEYPNFVNFPNGTSPSGFTLDLFSGPLPPGVTIIGLTSYLVNPLYIVDGTANPPSPTTYNGTLRVRTNDGRVATFNFSIVATPPTVMDSGSLPGGTLRNMILGADYGGYVSDISGGDSNYPNYFSVTSGSLPPGITLESDDQNFTVYPTDSILSGTPTATGTYNFTVTVTDPIGGTTSAPYQITVLPYLNVPLQLGPPTLPIGTAGASYSAQLTATNGGAPYTYVLTNATTLPPGLGLSPSGLISGTVNANDSGTYNFQVLGTDNTHPLDGGPLTATQSYSITVQAGPLQLSPSTLPDATQLATYTIVLSATGGVPPYTFAAQGLPPGINLPPNSNTISGVCTGTSLAQVTLSVTDAANHSLSEGPLPVGCNPTPVITNANPLPNGAINVPYSVAFVTNALYHPPGAAPFTWTLNVTQGSLSGLLFNAATGVLSGTPTATGTTGFNITFTDRWGATTTKGFTYTIYPKLVITTTSLPSGQAGVVYPSTPLAVTGGTGSGTYVFSATGLPQGLSIDPSSGVISGMPTQSGNFTPAFKVTDNSGQTATKTIPLTIAPAAPIVITTPKVLPTGDSGHAYSHQIQWTGGVPSYTVTGTGLPAWLSIDNNGNLMGMPPVPGTFQFSVTVKDSEDPPETATKSFTLVVNGPSITSTSPLPPATIGIPYSFTFTASGGAPAYTWTATGLPNWLALTHAGVLSGTPPANSPPITFTVTVTDSHGDFSSGSFVLPVTGGPLLFLTTTPLTAATAGVSYSTTFSSTGGTPPYTFTAANLPNWLTLNPDGALTGTPPAPGPVTFTVTVSDNAENSTSQLFTLPVNSVLNIGTTSPLSPATVGGSYTNTLLASGGTGVYTWTATGLPNWLTLSASGVLTGTPTAAGSFSFNVTVQDSANATASRLFTVQADQTLIITTPTTLPPATGGLGYLTTFAAAGGIGPYSWTATGLPNGLTLTPTGVLMGTYPTGNQFSFQVTVADSANHSANGTFSLTVNQSLIIGTTSPLPSATIGFLYNVNFTASGGSGGYTWSATGLPPWLTFTEAGFLTGVPPPSATQVSLTVTVKDQANNPTQGTFVVPVNPALAITNTSPLPPGTIGSPYSLQIAATGGAGNYSWLATGLPVWLTLSPAGLLSGTPPNGNAVSFTVDVIDAQDNETAKNFTLPVNASLVITTSSPLPPASVGVLYTDQFTATGGSGGYVWSATGLPQWLSMSPAGVLSGTPPVGAADVTFSVTVKDSQNESASGPFTLPVNRPLMIITTSPLPPATIGVPYKTLIVSSGGTGGNTWTATGLPSWLTLTSGSNGAFLTGTPPPGATSVTFTITVTDQTNDKASKPFLLPINSPLVITTTSPLPAATIGVQYSDQFTASGGSGGYTWTATGLPQWLTMSPAGVLSGTPPPGAVAVTFSVTVKDSQNDSANGSFTLPVNPALVITTTSPLPPATIGAAYSDQFTASGGSGGYTWSATGLPQWLTMSPAGVLGGTPPPGAVAVTFNVTVKDSQNDSASGTFTLPVNPALVITTTSPLPAATIGVHYLDQFAATGGSGSYTWTATGLPVWLTMSPGGLLSGTPPQGATAVTFDATVTDSQNDKASGTFTLPINPAGTLTITTTSPLSPATIEIPYGQQFAATGGSGAGYNWSATGLPAWLSITQGGLLFGTPPLGATSVTFDVTVTDSQNHTATGTFTLPVNPAGTLTITTTSPLSPATIAESYSAQFTATGGSETGYSWVATGLPVWLTMSTGGLLSGTPPPGATAVTFDVTVTDSQNNSATGTFTLPVNPAAALTILTTSPLPPGTLGVAYSEQFSATGGSGSGYVWTASGLPNWLIMTTGGLLSGTPPPGATSVTFTATVTDSANHTASGTFTLPLNPAGTLTITTTSPLPPATLEVAYSQQFAATGGSNSGYTWTATGLPSWLTMTSGGLLSGTPPPGAAAVTFDVTVTDSKNNTANGIFTLPVNPGTKLIITTTSPLPPATIGVAYSDQFAATGGSGVYTWTATGLPVWLTMSAGGLLTGTPPVGAAAVTFNVTVTDTQENTVTGTFTLPVNPALVITTTSPLPPATIGVTYSDQFAATGGSGNYTWTATGLPAWLTMTAGGLLVGTPPQGAAAVTFNVTVKDSQSNSASGTFTLPVNPAGTLTITTTSPLPTAFIAVAYAEQFAANGGSGGYSWSATGLPAWLTMSTGGLLSGTPPFGATAVTFNVTVKDSQNNTASGTFTLPVNEAGVLTILTTSPLAPATIGVLYAEQFAATGGSGGNKWTATGLPAWLTMSTGGLLSGTPPVGATTVSFNVTVTDSQLDTASGTFVLPVNAAGTLTITTTSPLSPATIEIPYSQQFAATGGSGSGYSWSATGLPAWLSISPGGLLFGTPPVGAAAVTFDVTVTDSQNNTSSGTFTLPVNPAGTLTITTTSPLSPATIGATYSAQFTATGGSGSGYSWIATGLPAWLTMTSGGLLSGIPPLGATAVTFNVTVTDSQNNSASGTFTLPVNPAATLTIVTTSPLPPATLGVAYADQFAATGGSGSGYVWTASGLPAWLTVTTGGLLSGTPPPGAAAVTFTATVTDSANHTASGTFTVPVNPAGTLTITTTSPLPAATIGVAYSDQFAATGGSGSGYTWTATGLPSWLTMTAAGLLSGTPPQGATAVTFDVTVTDSKNNTANGIFTLPVNPEATLTITTTSPLPAATVGVPYSDQFAATGGSGSGYTWTATGLPGWLSMSTGGLLSGTPPVGATSVTFNVTVTDSQNNTASGPFTLPVNPVVPTLTITTTSPLPAATVGVAYSDQFTATGGSGGYTWTATGLPGWLTMSTGGLLTGTPPVGATAVTFNVTVTDSQNNTASGTFTLPVNPVIPVLTITTTSPLPAATVGVAYSDQFAATGGSGVYTWTATGLPSWLTLTTSGLLVGTPPQGATAVTFDVTAKDSQNNTASGTFTLPVNPAGTLTITTTSPLTPAFIGVAYAQQFAATGGSGSYSWTAIGLPAWLTISAGGLLSGTPPLGATAVTFDVTVKDSQNHSASGAFTLPVNESGVLTITTTSPLSAATIGVAYSQQLAATGGAGALTWGATGLPAWLSITTGGLLVGTPPQGATTVTFDVTVTDSQNNTASGTFTLPVNPAGTLTITTTSPLAPATIGVAYSQQFAATGGSGSGYTWAATGLPGWLTLSAGGLLNGTPPQGATAVTFTIAVTDSQNNTASGTFTLPVIEAGALTITTTSPLTPATIGVAYSQQFAATGGSGSYTWTATGLPAWLTMSAGGILAGTPPVGATTVTFNVTVNDSQNNQASATFTLPVNASGTLTITTTSPLTAATIGVAYSDQFTATGGSGSYTWTATGLPSWLSMSAGGLLTGTPPQGATAVTFNVTVKDSQNNAASGAFTLPVNPASALTITTTSPLPAANMGVAYSDQFTATGGSGSGYTWTATGLPAWLSMSSGGLLTGTPPQGATAVTFNVTVTDSQNNTASGSFTLPVVATNTLTITTTSPLPAATLNVQYSDTLTATGGSGGYVWTSTNLPSWLKLSPGGVLAGTPTVAGPYGFTVTVTDSKQATASKTLTIEVSSGVALHFTTQTLGNCAVGVPCSDALSAAGGIPPYTFSLAPGETLGPLTLSPNGSISGTPLSGGTITFTAQVTDAAGTTVSQSFSIVVAGALVIDTPSLPSGVVGVRYSVGLHVTGGHPPYSWSLVAGSLPPGLNLNPATGGITGLPATAGSYSFSVQVSSGGETSQPVAYSITITQTSGQGPSNKIIVITSPQDLPPATLGSAYTQQLTAVGGTGAYTWSVSSGSLPAGLTLGANGAFSGTPTTAGSSTFSATVADTQGDQTTQQFTLLVVNPATATIITVSPLPDGVVGQTYNYGISITGGTPPYTWSIQQGTIPDGLSFDSSSGTFSGVPATTGTFSFVLTVTDSGTGGHQTSESKNYNIKVVGPADFHITTAPLLQGGTANVAYTTTFAATGGTRPYSWQLLSGSLPSGLTLDPNGTLAGTTTASGNFSVTIQAVDTNQVVATQWFVLSIGATNTPRILLGGSLASGIVGTAYSQGLFATGGTTPYRWTVSAGSLPPGLSLDPTSGSISGTPTQKGTFGFTAHIADATGATASQAFTINVFANDLTITSTSPLPNASVNVPYTVGLAATGGTPPYRWSLTAGSLAAGLSIDPATGAISGTPTQAGALSFTVLVTDQNFGRASQAFSLTVGKTQLTITSSPSLAGTVGVNFSSTLTATQGDPPYTWSVTAGTLPPGISLSASGTLSGTPTTAGTSHFTVQVTDTTSGKAQLAITFVVSAPSFAITTTSPLPAGTAGTPYSVTLQSAGGSGAITWSLASGTLPTGLSLASTGVLAGTPTLAEDSSFSVKATDSTGASVTASFQVHIAAPPVPTATFAGLPATVNPGDQPNITVQLPNPYPLPITITATLSITPNLSDNTDLLFANGSRTAQFTVPANAASFSFSFQAGTLAGQIQVGLTLQAAGKDVTPSPAPVLNTQILAAAPTIRIVSVTQITGGFQVVVDGISTPRDMKTANFQFTPATGANLQTTSATVDVTSFFAQWYQNPSSFTTGSQFALTVPFTISGNLSSIASVSVTMTNSVGTSAAVTAAVP